MIVNQTGADGGYENNAEEDNTSYKRSVEDYRDQYQYFFVLFKAHCSSSSYWLARRALSSLPHRTEDYAKAGRSASTEQTNIDTNLGTTKNFSHLTYKHQAVSEPSSSRQLQTLTYIQGWPTVVYPRYIQGWTANTPNSSIYCSSEQGIRVIFQKYSEYLYLQSTFHPAHISLHLPSHQA